MVSSAWLTQHDNDGHPTFLLHAGPGLASHHGAPSGGAEKQRASQRRWRGPARPSVSRSMRSRWAPTPAGSRHEALLCILQPHVLRANIREAISHCHAPCRHSLDSVAPLLFNRRPSRQQREGAVAKLTSYGGSMRWSPALRAASAATLARRTGGAGRARGAGGAARRPARGAGRRDRGGRRRGAGAAVRRRRPRRRCCGGGARVLERFGSVDLLVNNAGYGHHRRSSTGTSTTWSA